MVHWGRFSLALFGDKENRPQWTNLPSIRIPSDNLFGRGFFIIKCAIETGRNRCRASDVTQVLETRCL